MKQKWNWNNAITWKQYFMLSAIGSMVGLAAMGIITIYSYLYPNCKKYKEEVTEEETAE